MLLVDRVRTQILYLVAWWLGYGFADTVVVGVNPAHFFRYWSEISDRVV